MKKIIISVVVIMLAVTAAYGTQTIRITHPQQGKRFDGIGAVNGGGATSVLLKDYPEPQRSQIMDMVFKPMFGASVSAMLVEIPGDGNSTQGSMPSHSHYRGDCNFERGYTWWVMREAQQRNPRLALDATAWSAPAWVGNFWSDDMVDYYIAWLRGLREVHGLELDALGCHNEKGWSADFAKHLRKAMNENGFAGVKLHGFGNWGKKKMDFVKTMQEDKELADALDAVCAHTYSEIPLTKEQRAAIEAMGKPIWNSEDHVYRKGFDCLISIVKCFNENYIVSGATRVINWYDIAGVYPLEPYSCDPAMLLAREPWSGHYEVREALWGYAHYGQFTQVGWQYVDEGCLKLDGGGSTVTLRNPATNDYSVIFETKDAKEPQTVEISLGKKMGQKTFCVWMSNEQQQFVRQSDITAKNGTLTLTLQPHTVYSVSTTSGQQKGSFEQIPSSKPFPLPYKDNFDDYEHPAASGYLPHYTADIIGAFELTERPDHNGQCIRQTVGEHTLSWAPEWHHYTILGDSAWTDYEVSADVYLNPKDEAGIMGRLCDVGSGYGIWAKGYYLKLNDQGVCTLVLTRGKHDPKEMIGDAEQQALILARKDKEIGGEYTLAIAQVKDVAACQWHNLKLRFQGSQITGYVDGQAVISVTSDHYKKGMAGLLAPLQPQRVSTPYFDNLIIAPLDLRPSLEATFKSPSDETKPIMIWQWMDGLVSKEGITADLEAYKAAGIGGVQQFLVGGPMQVMARDTTNAIGTDNWSRLMRHAISECARLGLTFGTHNCPGWSSSAYPTVTPEYSMQKLVWTKGNKEELPERPEVDNQWNYYEDIAVVFVPDDSIVALEDIRVYKPSDFPLKQKAHRSGWFYRFGHTTNGRTNYATAPTGGRGLECDKMNREAVKRFWDAYPARLIALAGKETGRTFQRLEIDSYEAGGQEWTKLMSEEFIKRRGYDILPWLPALAGVTINSKEATQKMKRDWQETVTDLFAENYYGYMSQLASENGLQLMVQPYGTGSSKPFNPINTNKIVRQIAPNATICAEFWTKPDNWGWKDVPRVVSAARSSGRQQVYAEGFTCWPLHAWKDDPAALKLTADRAFCLGVNRMMLHAAAQNPWPNAKPGMTFGQWGTWWTPGQTWWKNGATALFAYMSHCQALLQRGEYVDNFQSMNPSLTADTKSLQWIHRKDGETDIYFIANIKDTTFTSTLSFNFTGRIPELWNLETGSIETAQAWLSEDGKNKVALHFDTHQSLFLVFRKTTPDKGPGLQLQQSDIVKTIPIDGHWTVSFPNCTTIDSDTLFSWHESANPDIKYFSGTARYTTTIRMKMIDRTNRYILDLGELKNLAVVTVNGQLIANLWHAPFKADITDVLRKGENTLEIDVTNLWVNRMIGDEQEDDDVEWSDPVSFGAASGKPGIVHFMKSVPEWLSKGQPRPSKNRKAVISFKFYEKDAPILPSGLLGPVVITKLH